MKRTFSLFMAAFLVLALTACGNISAQQNESGEIPAFSQPDGEKAIGISVPNDTDPRWALETAELTRQLKHAGLAAIVKQAQDDVSVQATQIQALIAKPVTCLVVAAIDSLSLTDVLLSAKQAGIPVIAYDRLLMQTDAVAGYVGWDYQALGTAMAEHIVKARQLETAQAENRSHTIEFFMGSPDDNNAVLLYAGIQQVLQPYLDCGVLVCRSGRTAFEDVCMQGWSAELASTLCESHLETCYTDAPPEILCAASDSLADGCVSALESAEFVSSENWPLIIGQGGTETAMQRLASGQQSLTVQKDLTDLPTACFQAITAALDTSAADWNGPVCHNGIVSVPARFCGFTLVDQPSPEL